VSYFPRIENEKVTCATSCLFRERIVIVAVAKRVDEAKFGNMKNKKGRGWEE
jgi:hypothetical protein